MLLPDHTALDSSLRTETFAWRQERTVPPLTRKVAEEDQTKPERRLMALTKRHALSQSQGPSTLGPSTLAHIVPCAWNTLS